MMSMFHIILGPFWLKPALNIIVAVHRGLKTNLPWTYHPGSLPYYGIKNKVICFISATV